MVGHAPPSPPRVVGSVNREEGLQWVFVSLLWGHGDSADRAAQTAGNDFLTVLEAGSVRSGDPIVGSGDSSLLAYRLPGPHKAGRELWSLPLRRVLIPLWELHPHDLI